MTCYSPLTAYRLLGRFTKNGKNVITFDYGQVQREYGNISEQKYLVQKLTVPCGFCVGCRLSKSREWAVRCVHEAMMYENNCFITLTYDEAHVPLIGERDEKTLVKADLQKFWKRLRFQFPNASIRYYAVGEYGSKFERPHYHAIIFNFDFEDKEPRRIRRGYTEYTSKTLSRLWPFGFSTIGSVSFESAAYVARYCLKKLKHSSIDYGERLPEFTCMSLKPGIGFEYYKKYTTDIYDRDSVFINKHMQLKPPRYYDKLFDVDYPESFEIIKENRMYNASLKPEVNDSRMYDMQKFKLLSLNRYTREYENDIYGGIL